MGQSILCKDHRLNTNGLLEFAVCFALSEQNRPQADAAFKALKALEIEHISPEDLENFKLTLHGQGISEDAVSFIVRRVIAGKMMIRRGGTPHLTTGQYEECRERILALTTAGRLGISDATWPPTAQTVANRIGQGAWGPAMIAMGIRPPANPAVSAERFTRADYEQAITVFIEFAVKNELPISSSQYDSWRSTVSPQYPSLASVRNRFGGWKNAVRNDPKGRLAGNAKGIESTRIIRKSLGLVGSRPEAIADDDEFEIYEIELEETLDDVFIGYDYDKPRSDDDSMLELLKTAYRGNAEANYYDEDDNAELPYPIVVEELDEDDELR